MKRDLLVYRRRDRDPPYYRGPANTSSKLTRQPDYTPPRALTAGAEALVTAKNSRGCAVVLVGEGVVREKRRETRAVRRRIIQYYYCSVLQRLVKRLCSTSK